MKTSFPPLRKLILVSSMFLLSVVARAQFVTIPDTNFVNWLNNNGYAQCLNGNQLDTTCPEVTLATGFVCDTQNIYDLTGIQYFKGLYSVECIYNHLTALPPLPPALNSLVCNNNRITNLPQLPSSLNWLNCTYNKLDSLPALPDSLQEMWCDFNPLHTLPVLPPNLIGLSCDSDLLTELPALPPALQWFYCLNNNLTALPILPAGLVYFNCEGNQITSLPALPPSLTALLLTDNQLTTLPTLPDSLISIECENNLLTSLPALPASLTWLDVEINQLTSLPALPAGLIDLSCNNNLLSELQPFPPALIYLNCSYNYLTTIPALTPVMQVFECEGNMLDSLPVLPSGLTDLGCDENNLTTLPLLPSSLNSLSCSRNFLTLLPALSDSLYWLECSFNNLTLLPPLPDSLYYFDCAFNPNLYCMPPLMKFVGIDGEFFISNTGITCLPNAIQTYFPIPAIDTMPICDPGNSNGCISGWNILGKVYNDANGNCTADNGEQLIFPVKMNLYLGDSIIQSGYFPGYYSFVTADSTYVVQVDTANLPFNSNCSVDSTVTVSVSDSLRNGINFGLQCKPGFDVGVAYIVGRFRAARFTTLHIGAGDISNLYNAQCAAGISGSVTVTITGPANYVSPAAGASAPSMVNGNTLTWVVPDFGAVRAYSSFNIMVETDTTAQIADPVCVTVSVTPLVGDYDTSNNMVTHCFGVSSSYDPNEKQVSPSGGIASANEWLTYTVYFQNTGNDTARNISITDTLDRNLDPTTFQFISSSAKATAQVKGNVAVFRMANINLPDTSGNNPFSEGYVQYRVKMKSGLADGVQIQNTAWVYFDFNPPVSTNTTSSTLAINAGVTGLPTNKLSLNLFPNPSTGLLNLAATGFTPQWISIYDIEGRMINKQPFTPTINIAILSNGVYFIEAKDEAIAIRQKVVKFSSQ